MASAPFNISITTPADADTISQFPANERSNRDVIKSFLELEHDPTTGRHKQVGFTNQDPAPAGTANIVTMWAKSGRLYFRNGTGSVSYIGDRPGTYKWTANSTADEGYLFCFGQAVSRSTYAELFTEISTTYGVGDGSTTFNLPDGRGRALFGKDNMGGVAASRITTAGAGFDGLVLGAAGGTQGLALVALNMPNITIGGTVSSHTHPYSRPSTAAGASGSDRQFWEDAYTTVNTSATAPACSVTLGDTARGGAQTQINKMPPGMIGNLMIRT